MEKENVKLEGRVIRRWMSYTPMLVGGFVWLTTATTSMAAVNIYATTPALQQDFLGMTTTYYLGTLTPNPYFPGTFSYALTGKNGTPPPNVCPVCSPPSTLDTQLAIATNTLTSLSTNYFLYGWYFGKEDERTTDIGLVMGYSGCSTSTFKAPSSVSSTTWKVPKIDTTTCSFILGYVANSIYEQSFSSPTYLVPGY